MLKEKLVELEALVEDLLEKEVDNKRLYRLRMVLYHLRKAEEHLERL